MKKRLTYYALIALMILVLIPFVGQGQPKDAEKKVGPPEHVLEKMEQKQEQIIEKVQEKLQDVEERVKNPKALEAKLKQAWKRQIGENYSEEEMDQINQISNRLQDRGYQIMQVGNIFANGKSMKFDVPPVIKDGRTLIPVRALSAAYNFEVDYDSDTRTVTLDRDDLEIAFVLDENIAIVNGEEYELDVPASSLEGRSVLPLRFFIDQLGIDIKYNSADKTIGIGIDPEEVEKLYENILDEIEDAIEERNELKDFLTDEDKEQLEIMIDDLVQIANNIDNAIENEASMNYEQIKEEVEEIEENLEDLYEKYDALKEEINLENYLEDLNKEIVNSISKRDARKENLTDDEIDEINDLIDELILISNELDTAIEDDAEINIDDIDNNVDAILNELEDYFEIDAYILEEMDNLRSEILEELVLVEEKISIVEDSLSEEDLSTINENIEELEAIVSNLTEAIDDEVLMSVEILEDDSESYFENIENTLRSYHLEELAAFSIELDDLILEFVEQKELNEGDLNAEELEAIDSLIDDLVGILSDVNTAIINEQTLDLETLEEEVENIEDQINEYFFTEA